MKYIKHNGQKYLKSTLSVDKTGMVRFERSNGSSQPLFRIDKGRILVFDKLSKTECLLPAKRIGNLVIIDLSDTQVDIVGE